MGELDVNAALNTNMDESWLIRVSVLSHSVGQKYLFLKISSNCEFNFKINVLE